MKLKRSKKEVAVRKKKEVALLNETTISKLVLRGDLSALTPVEKVDYFNTFCRHLGLNPITQPFSIIKTKNGEQLYANKSATQQLRKINGVSINDLTAVDKDGVYTVKVHGNDRTGRKDTATGAVSIMGMKGEMLANAIMKAETKAKRRFTLSICGLGILDESEIDSIPDNSPAPMPQEKDVTPEDVPEPKSHIVPETPPKSPDGPVSEAREEIKDYFIEIVAIANGQRDVKVPAADISGIMTTAIQRKGDQGLLKELYDEITK